MPQSTLIDLVEEINTLQSLKPSKKVNGLFTNLVENALSLEKHTLSSSQLARLQEQCATAEYELEKYWANKIINSKNPHHMLEKFPYIKNYQKLTQMEWFSLLSCTKHTAHKVLFVGAGPLPLTAIVLAQHYVDSITILDYDKAACEIAQQVINKLNLTDKIKVVCSDAQSFEKYGEFDVIVVAALAGIKTNTKRNILKRIKQTAQKDIHILARSSWGTREILYNPLDEKLFNIFTPLIEVRPHHDVVNSVIIFKL